jgi:hypothetical protein
MTKAKKQKTDAELFDELEAAAELERIKNLSADEVAAEVLADGGDPGAIGARGAALAAAMMPERQLEWTDRAAKRSAAMDERIGAWPVFATMSRADMEARVETARRDARFSAPVVSAYRKRGEGELTDDELRALLEEIEVLRRLHGGENK